MVESAKAELEDQLLPLAHGHRSVQIDPRLFVAATRRDGPRYSESNIMDLVLWSPINTSVVEYFEEQTNSDDGSSDPGVSHYEARHQEIVTVSVNGEIKGAHSPERLPEVGDSLLDQLRLRLCEQIIAGRGAEHHELLGTLNVAGVQHLNIGEPSTFSVAAAVAQAHSKGDEFPSFVAMNFEDRRKIILPPIPWEIPLISCPTVPAGMLVTGCFLPHAELYIKSVRVRAGEVQPGGHRRVASEADAALVHLRPAAFVVANFRAQREDGPAQAQRNLLGEVSDEEWQEFDRATRESGTK